MKRLNVIACAAALLGAVSCSPVGSSFPGTSATARGGGVAVEGGGAPLGSVGGNERATSGDLRQIREQRQAVGGEQLIHSGRAGSGAGGIGGQQSGSGAGSWSGSEDVPVAELPPLEIDYRYAMPVPGRGGWVYNPYTNRPVDVRGVESGRLIYDERDPANRQEDGTLKPVSEMPNKFRVP